MCLLKIDVKRFVSGACDKKLKVWNFNDGKCLKTIDGKDAKPDSLLKINN